MLAANVSTTAFNTMSTVLAAHDESELLNRVESVAHDLGFENVMFGVELRRPPLAPTRHIISDYPKPWWDRYTERDYSRIDPILNYCKERPGAVVWSDGLQDTPPHEFWEEARHYGLGYGVSVSAHDPAGSYTMLSLARDQALEGHEARRGEMLQGVNVLAACTHLALTRLVVPRLIKQQAPSLSAREVECLRWAAQGKTSWEIGRILNVSEPTAIFHLKNATQKLKAVNRIQAIALAVAMGIVN